MRRAAPHVLMTADAVGGVWTYALDLGRGLAEAGMGVTLAVPGPAPDAGQRTAAKAAGLALEPLGGALDWTAAQPGEVAASAARLVQLCTQLRPELVHLNSPALAAFGPFPAPVLAACHSCVKTWWAAVKGQTRLPGDLAWRAALVEEGYGNADALVAPSRAFAQATRMAYGLGTAPDVVLNGRALPLDGGGLGGGARAAFETNGAGGGAASRALPDPSCAHPHPCPSPFEGEGSVHVLSAGRLWDEGKDVATLDRAVGRAGLSAAAAGPLQGPQGQAVTLHHLTALGRLSDAELQARLAQRPVFVSPSLYEPFGLAVLEAAQRGCPLVLCDIATFRELWDGAAVFFAPGDDAALAATLAGLAADPGRREQLGAAARARAARFTVAAMTDATLQLYAALSPAVARPVALRGAAA